MQKFCISLREHPANVINFEEKEMLLLTKDELKSYQEEKVCYICGKIIFKKLSKSMNFPKVRDHWKYTGKYGVAAHIIHYFILLFYSFYYTRINKQVGVTILMSGFKHKRV